MLASKMPRLLFRAAKVLADNTKGQGNPHAQDSSGNSGLSRGAVRVQFFRAGHDVLFGFFSLVLG